MSLPENIADTSHGQRWCHVVCWGLIVLSLSTMSYRLMLVRSPSGRTPMLSANDRSRWATVRALVDHGGYELDEVIFRDHSNRRNNTWYSIDLVRHRSWDGQEHYYSSKPPLLTTLLAGKYWVLQRLTGLTLRYDIFTVIRILLVTTNILPLLLYFALLKRWGDEYARLPWSRVYWMAAATFGTLITPFASTLSNHLPAAISALVATYMGLRIFQDRVKPWWYFGICGMAAAFTVANELPSLAFTALLTLWLVVYFPRKMLLGYLPGAALVAAAFFGTNYLAHGTLRPAYAHRSDGPVIARLELAPPWSGIGNNVEAEDGVNRESDELAESDVAEPSAAVEPSDGEPRRGVAVEQSESEFPVHSDGRSLLASVGIEVSGEAVWRQRISGDGWQLWDPETEQRFACWWEGNKLEIRRWGQWYEYEGSYWLPGVKQGVDRGEPNPWIYAFHALLGHHGIFSLTPIWLLSLLGVLLAWTRAGTIQPIQRNAILSIALVTLVCLLFYLTRPQLDRNYGGVSCGLRWMIWLTPLWLYCMLPALDRVFSHRGLAVFAWLSLGVSLFSAWYPALNPWTHPWLFQLLDHWGWIRFV